MLSSYLAILIFLIVALGFAVFTIVFSYLLGPRKPSEEKLMPYECGMDPIGSARRRFSIKFFVIAMLFIVFDIEVMFLYPWAIIFKELKLFGLIEMGVFIAILFIALAYVWKKGALEWE
ncbi:MAG: NADH-quinone oxidoreductase subunit A [Deltaproteobacteria bacterium]|nr:NADH-quinone oxidoreductase subunit A [Deltaproteobacteria bacterium]